MMTKSVLKTYQEQGKVVAIYTDPTQTDSFSAGYILDVDESHLLLGSIDTCGNYDGYIVKCIEDIFLIEIDTAYTKKLQKLYTIKNQTHGYSSDSANDDILQSVLNYAKSKKKVVSIQLLDSGFEDVSGMVKSIADQSVFVSLLDEFGESGGEADCLIQDISALLCDSQENIAKMLLFSQGNA